ncbi:MAG: hypothetical protein ACRDRY_17765 [Pseudonocardiaceae bacterium]
MRKPPSGWVYVLSFLAVAVLAGVTESLGLLLLMVVGLLALAWVKR